MSEPTTANIILEKGKNEIHYSPMSMMDDFGRVFYLNNKIYRAIHNAQKQFCIDLLNSDLFKDLSAAQLIPKTTIADFSLESHELVLEHEKLTVTHQYEWSFSMLKDASIMVLKVNELCGKYGYELKDAHTMNVLFKGTKPMWVDIGSIVPKKTYSVRNWTAYYEFIGSFLIPLIFWSEGNIYVARKLLESNFYRIDLLPSQTLLESELLSLLKNNIRHYRFSILTFRLFSTPFKIGCVQSFCLLINRISNFITRRNNIKFFSYHWHYQSYENTKRILNKLFVPVISSSWQDYQDHYYTVNGKQIISSRFNRILKLINNKSENIKSVLDLAGNQGLMCTLIKEKTTIDKITLVDYDSNAIDFAFNKLKLSNIDSINLLVLNFMFNIDLIGTATRIKSDLVLAMAVTHHLILSSNYSLSAIFERIKSYSNKYVMIEFMPLGLWATGSKIYPKLPDWYNEKWFEDNFIHYFELISKEKLETNRILFFGEIIN